MTIKKLLEQSLVGKHILIAMNLIDTKLSDTPQRYEVVEILRVSDIDSDNMWGAINIILEVKFSNESVSYINFDFYKSKLNFVEPPKNTLISK